MSTEAVTHLPADPKIIDLIQKDATDGKPYVSVEFFPPRSEEAVKSLYQRMDRMKEQFQPLFTDVTWGAGGSTATLTMQLCQYAHDHGHVSNMHLTCTNVTDADPVEAIHKALEEAHASGIRNIVALRGDPPLGQSEWKAADGGFTCALDLVQYIRKQSFGQDFGISVAGYPEGHPNAISEIEDPSSLTEAELARSSTSGGKLYCCKEADYEKELDYLKRKVEAGADFIITQMFFDIQVFEQFVKDCRAHGISVPIVPGIMCITTYGGFCRMTGFCKTRVPAELQSSMDALKDATDAQVRAFGIEFGTKLCQDLIDRCQSNVLHFYTLNLEKVVYGILNNLQLLPTSTTTAAAAAATGDDEDAALMVAKGSAWARVGDEVTSIFGKGIVRELNNDTGMAAIVLQSWILAGGQRPIAYLQKDAYSKVF